MPESAEVFLGIKSTSSDLQAEAQGVSNAVVPQAMSVEAFRESLARHLGGNTQVEIRNEQFEIRQGMWRGASLELALSSQAGAPAVRCYIPSFMAKVILFLVSVAAFSLLLTVVLTMVLGEFVPAFAGVGGMAGYGMYSIIKTIVVANIRSSWTPEIQRAWESAKAELGA